MTRLSSHGTTPQLCVSLRRIEIFQQNNNEHSVLCVIEDLINWDEREDFWFLKSGGLKWETSTILSISLSFIRESNWIFHEKIYWLVIKLFFLSYDKFFYVIRIILDGTECIVAHDKSHKNEPINFRAHIIFFRV